tara:strand:+ start:1145 stop:1612 length:468 start_codon:yes stop_codon:yes gene_type:complete
MNIIEINENGCMDIIQIDKSKSIKKSLNNDMLTILYYWRYDGNYIKALGLDDQNQLENVHKLPILGLSDIFNDYSNKVRLFGKIYIYKTDINNNLLSISIPEYAELFSLYNNDYTSEEYSEEEEDINESTESIIKLGKYNEYNFMDELDIDINQY